MPGPEGKFLVVGVHLRTPIDYAREMDRAMHYYAHVVACLAEVADPQRRSFLESRQGEVLEELAARGDEGAGIEIERRRWKSHLSFSTERAARAGVRLNVPKFDPDRPLGPGTMVRWAAQGPLDYAGRLDPKLDRFVLGEWVNSSLPATPGGLIFTETDKLPWHDPRVPESGREAALALAQHEAGILEPVIDPPRKNIPNPSHNVEPTEGWAALNRTLSRTTDGSKKLWDTPTLTREVDPETGHRRRRPRK
jgi:hypothetical protein